jgi:hypothetical protein
VEGATFDWKRLDDTDRRRGFALAGLRRLGYTLVGGMVVGSERARPGGVRERGWGRGCSIALTILRERIECIIGCWIYGWMDELFDVCKCCRSSADTVIMRSGPKGLIIATRLTK